MLPVVSILHKPEYPVNINRCTDYNFSGREYGTLSIEIHLKSCKQKWEMEESKKPVHQRRPMPEPPKNFDDLVIGVK
jgi:hypothetical protein